MRDKIKLVWKRIRNVFTGEQELELFMVRRVKNEQVRASLVQIMELNKNHNEDLQELDDTIRYLSDSVTDYKKEMLERGKHIKELNKELSDMAIDYFSVHDSRDKMIKVMEQHLPGHVDII